MTVAHMGCVKDGFCGAYPGFRLDFMGFCKVMQGVERFRKLGLIEVDIGFRVWAEATVSYSRYPPRFRQAASVQKHGQLVRRYVTGPRKVVPKTPCKDASGRHMVVSVHREPQRRLQNATILVASTGSW